MKRITHVTAIILSLLIIYLGAGVVIVHYCCGSCEQKADAIKECCMLGDPHQEDLDAISFMLGHSTMKSAGSSHCSSTLYQLDLIKQVSNQVLSVPVIQLFCELYSSFSAIQTEGLSIAYLNPPPPPPNCAKQLLALYATYLI